MRKNRGNRGFNTRPLPNHKDSDTLRVLVNARCGGRALVVEDPADVHADALG
jgi:hypothetical protein